jgi:hypothetical protein
VKCMQSVHRDNSVHHGGFVITIVMPERRLLIQVSNKADAEKFVFHLIYFLLLFACCTKKKHTIIVAVEFGIKLFACLQMVPCDIQTYLSKHFRHYQLPSQSA